jgi:DNA-binding SARP family transcriptional activator
LSVLKGGRPWPAAEVGSRKARTTLAFLAVRSDRFAAVDEIIEALWSDHPPQGASANVATLVSRLRSVLGRSSIVGEGGRYRLGDDVAVDLYDATALLSRAEARLRAKDGPTALHTAQQVIAMLGDGIVLPEYPDAAWAASARPVPVGLMRRARLVIAEAALLAGDTLAAREVAEQAVAEDPLDEPAYRALMCAHAVAGEPVRALATYDRLRTVLADELGIDPAPVTREMHIEILRSKVPSPRNAALTGWADYTRPQHSGAR